MQNARNLGAISVASTALLAKVRLLSFAVVGAQTPPAGSAAIRKLDERVNAPTRHPSGCMDTSGRPSAQEALPVRPYTPLPSWLPRWRRAEECASDELLA